MLMIAGWTDSLKVELPQAGGQPIIRDYLRGWFVEGHAGPFARAGDSGSIVVDEDECVVAMVVALRTDPGRGAPWNATGAGE